MDPSSIAHGTEIVWSTLESGAPSDTSGPEVRRARRGVAIGTPYRNGRGWVVEVREFPGEALHVVLLSEITRRANKGLLALPPCGSHVTWDRRASEHCSAERRETKTGVVVTDPWQDALEQWVIEVQEDEGDLHLVSPAQIVSWTAYDGAPTGLLAAENAAPSLAPPLRSERGRVAFLHPLPIHLTPGVYVVWAIPVDGFAFPRFKSSKSGVVIAAPVRSGEDWFVDVRDDYDIGWTVSLFRIMHVEGSTPDSVAPSDGFTFTAKIPPRPGVPRPDESVARQEIERRLLASLGGSGRPYPPGIHELARHAAQAIWLRDERIAMLDRWLLEHNLALREEDRLAGRTPSREP